MLKRIKSVSMLLALAGVSSTGAAYAWLWREFLLQEQRMQ